jgi:hypothetical protein
MYGLILAAANSSDNLAQVQAGFHILPNTYGNDVKHLILLISSILLIALVLGLINIKRKRKKNIQGWSSITNSQSIWEVLTKAVNRQAHFILEIYEGNHTINFKGILESLEDDSYLVLSLSENPSIEANFSELPGVIHLNFRPGPKEPMEHYQFATKVVSNRFIKQGEWREAQLLLPLPKIITSAQRRSFLRLEPGEKFSFNCHLNNVPEGNIPNLENLEEVCVGQIMDISIGGAQIKLTATTFLRETQRFVGVMRLPLGGLDLDVSDINLVILMQLLSQEYVKAHPQFGQEAHAILRVRFLGRYLQDNLQNLWTYRGMTQNAFEDLAHWMLAYQRYMIKKKRNLLTPDNNNLRPPNMFPSTPPKRPPQKN